MAGPTVSVLLTVYNGDQYLRQAIDSVLAQTFDDFELVVVDDGSTDSTPDILATYEDPRIDVLHQPNRGRAPALNRGLIRSSGEYIAIIDADDIAVPERLETQVEILESDPTVDVLGSWYERRHEADPGRTKTEKPPLKDGDLKRVLPTYNPIAHSSVTYRKEAIAQVGGYDIGLIACIDYDLWIRLAAAGFTFRTADETLCMIRKHDDRSFDFSGRYRLLRWWTTLGIQWRAVDAVDRPMSARLGVLARNTKSLGVDLVDELRR